MTIDDAIEALRKIRDAKPPPEFQHAADAWYAGYVRQIAADTLRIAADFESQIDRLKQQIAWIRGRHDHK
jgi:hypothetical protein